MLLGNNKLISKAKTKASSVLILLLFLTFSGNSFANNKDSILTNNIIETIDHIIVVKNNSVVFEYLQTEEENENPVLLRVIEQPKFGEVHLNADQTFEYTPLQNLCEKKDAFVYEMTTSKQVMEVTVSVEILCESMTILNGMSTVEDAGKLEKFTILGIENFPNNSLYVFDDFGNQIFQKNGYANDWKGISEINNELIEKNRMYYFVLNDGGGRFYSGYLQIN